MGLKKCYRRMMNRSYGFVYYPELEVKWDFYFSGRPVTLEGYEEETHIPNEIFEKFEKMMTKYLEKYPNK